MSNSPEPNDPCARASARGFSLVEVLVAIGVVSVLVAGAAGVLTGASGAIRAGRASTTATLLAMQKVEQLRADPAVLFGTHEDHVAVDGTPGPASATGPGAGFLRRWTVTPASGVPDGAIVVVEVFSRGAGRVAELHALVGAQTP
ncbi:MAG: prepilin-type N-terminal cleavage/methylation domain-containing protein [Acidobacteria bacterium]|nr:prepilin-type N-terminal cleavage/methylation domain-containing protein [Acidobacteriota bacterium]